MGTQLLLDTHVLLWALDTPERLSADLRKRLENPNNTVYFSAASIWEIAIKASLGRANFSYSPEEIAQAALSVGFSELSITSGHVARVALLPRYYADPFDRLLVAQAVILPAHLITADSALVPYSELVELIH